MINTSVIGKRNWFNRMEISLIRLLVAAWKSRMLIGDPCGTPFLSTIFSENMWSFILTWKEHNFRTLVINFNYCPLMWHLFGIFKTLWCQILSYVFWRSNDRLMIESWFVCLRKIRVFKFQFLHSNLWLSEIS